MEYHGQRIPSAFLGIIAISLLLLLLPAATHAHDELSSPLENHGGQMLKGNLDLSVVFYGQLGRVQKNTIRSFLKSLNHKGPAAAGPQVSTWWRMVSSYIPGGSNINVKVVKQYVDPNYSLGKIMTADFIKILVKNAVVGFPRAVPVIVTARDVTVQGLCMGKCAEHGLIGNFPSPFFLIKLSVTHAPIYVEDDLTQFIRDIKSEYFDSKLKSDPKFVNSKRHHFDGACWILNCYRIIKFLKMVYFFWICLTFYHCTGRANSIRNSGEPRNRVPRSLRMALPQSRLRSSRRRPQATKRRRWSRRHGGLNRYRLSFSRHEPIQHWLLPTRSEGQYDRSCHRLPGHVRPRIHPWIHRKSRRRRPQWRRL